MAAEHCRRHAADRAMETLISAAFLPQSLWRSAIRPRRSKHIEDWPAGRSKKLTLREVSGFASLRRAGRIRYQCKSVPRNCSPKPIATVVRRSEVED
jgi:hypothetical protein